MSKGDTRSQNEEFCPNSQEKKFKIFVMPKSNIHAEFLKWLQNSHLKNSHLKNSHLKNCTFDCGKVQCFFFRQNILDERI